MPVRQTPRERGGLIAGLRARLGGRPATPPPPVARRRPERPAPPDPELERLSAEARYHRDRYEIHHARVISASPTATSPGRLRELERTATAAEQRLAHARRAARGDG